MTKAKTIPRRRVGIIDGYPTDHLELRVGTHRQTTAPALELNARSTYGARRDVILLNEDQARRLRNTLNAVLSELAK